MSSPTESIPAVFRSLVSAINQNKALEFARYAQLGTINADGTPSVRTVNMRGVLSNRALVFSTDARSAKMKEFQSASNKYVELCWFFPLTREQYRIRGKLQTIHNDAVGAVPTPFDKLSADASTSTSLSMASSSPLAPQGFPTSPSAFLDFHRNFWKVHHSPEARGMFEIAPPGTAKRRQGEGDLDKFEPQPIDENNPSKNFVTVLFYPVRCDYLKLPAPVEKCTGVQHRESELKPARQQVRWLHALDEETNQWSITELNA